MIKRMPPELADQVLAIWLSETAKAHPFIPNAYWAKNFMKVKTRLLPASETYVCVEGGQLKGFLSILDGNYIGALFVSEEFQGQGVGARLMEHVMDQYDELTLDVYAENTRAVEFYERCGFYREDEGINEETDHLEYKMSWISSDMEELLFGMQC
ncbi:MAG: N-acetyltransferase [Firmicutes bacterium]|nr:N-acetyltransferase [Bacillota bacterium]